MLKSIAKLLDGLSDDVAADSDDREQSIRLATALLLVEVSRADFDVDISEQSTILDLLSRYFQLSVDETELLVQQARVEADRAASLQQFTRRLHGVLSEREKLRIVEMLWKVALADGRLDKYEDHLVRKVADLLYVRHSDLIRIRNRVKRS